LRIAIDGRAFASPAGGVRRYITELTRALTRLDATVELMALGIPDGAACPPEVRRVPAAPSLPTNVGWCLSGLPLTCRRAAFDVFHAPAYTAPLWGTGPLVLTIHDVSYARHPEWYPHARDPLRRAFYRASARHASRLITDSDFSRGEIHAAYGIPHERIDAIPLAAAGVFTPDATVRRGTSVLHVGDLHARRNLPALLDAVLALRRDDPRCAGAVLVLAGRDRGVLASLRAQAAHAGSPAALEYVGTPDDAALVGLYRSAGAFVYPSRYEGFGLPVLEAMACGAPVVASAAGAVPEVVGPAAIVVDPDDARGWVDAMRVLLSRPDLARERGEASLRRAAQFSWSRTAAATLDVYRRAAVASGRAAAG